ncbi:Spore maturation protein A-like protein [Olavius algarvensis associated proteobacterium Delta 3]|nr:Spore maturation protein A-like protein [Olavius algarvensis associated proteobacterium Delta 3]
MNIIFLILVLFSVGFAGWRQVFGEHSAGAPSPMEALSSAMVDSAGSAVELAIGLVGVMALFLGLMKVAEAGGMLQILSRLIRPLMIRLFPDVPPDHPAMGAMALFLAINTSSVTLLPTGVIALRAAAGSAEPAAILPTTLFATIGSTCVAIVAAKLYSRFAPIPQIKDSESLPDDNRPETDNDLEPIHSPASGYPFWVSLLALAVLAAMIPLAILYGNIVSPWILPGLMVGFLIFGVVRKVHIYEVFVEGATEGFQVALRIIPYLVAILVAVGMLRASGALEKMVSLLGPATSKLGLPAEALPMALMRPLSGSGAYGILASIINDPAIGPDSYTGVLVSTLQGSTETTFYVMAVYFGAVQVRRVRHALAAGLTADVAGILFAIIACSFLFR